MKIITLIIQKGGVGKTTCAINIGAGLNKLNRKILLVAYMVVNESNNGEIRVFNKYSEVIGSLPYNYK